MARAIKVSEVDGKKVATKEESEGLRGKLVILNPEKSEPAISLGIKEKGVYGIKFR